MTEEKENNIDTVVTEEETLNAEANTEAENVQVSYGSPVQEKLKENRRYIINRKERFYDTLIEKMHLTTWALDIFIIAMIVLAIVIVVTHAK